MPRRVAVLVAAALVGAAILLYLPALSLELMGDDYQWVQHARRAMHSPLLLFADLDTFYRPASTWTLAIDRALWGFRPPGYHFTNLLLHGAAAAALFFAARRLGLPLLAAAACGALWLASPLTSEPALAVAIRFENLLLLSWLGLALAWPRHDEAWTRQRTVAVVAATLFAAASKETWVVTAGIVVALEIGQRRSLAGVAARRALPFAVAAAAYAAAYFVAFPSDKGYFEVAAAPLAKVPHMLAAFLFLEPYTPADFPLSWRGLVALAMLAVAAITAWRRRSPAGLAGLALLALPIVPTLLVPYLPTRYTTIPYAGFVLLLAGSVSTALRSLPVVARHAATAGVAAVAALALGAGALGVRAELDDAVEVSSAHAALLAEAAAVAPTVPLDRPTAVVRADGETPLHALARRPRGVPKLYFVRASDPYGLVDAAALFEWALARREVSFTRVDDGGTRYSGRPGAILLHEPGRFVWFDRDTADVAAGANLWSERGFPVRWVQPMPPSGVGG